MEEKTAKGNELIEKFDKLKPEQQTAIMTFVNTATMLNQMTADMISQGAVSAETMTSLSA